MWEEVANRISERLAALDRAAQAVSIDAGMSRDAIRGILRKPESAPTIETIERLALSLGVSPAWLAYGLGDPPTDAGQRPTMAHLALAAPSPFRLKSQANAPRGREAPARHVGINPVTRAFNLAPVIGEVAAGRPRHVDVSDAEPELISVPRDPDFGMARQVVYQARGDSMDEAEPKPILDGDYLFCALWEDLNIVPVTGMIVVIEQSIAEGQYRERTVKELRVSDDKFEAVPRSSNPDHKPVSWLRGEGEDTAAVTILSLLRNVLDGRPIGLATGS